VTVNLAPPTVRKIGSGLDLAIAIAVLVASEQIEPGAVEGLAFLGELGLDGSLRPVPGTLCLAESLGDGAVVLPEASAAEAGLVSGRSVYGLPSLAKVVACLRGEEPWPESPPAAPVESVVPLPDLADVRGQPIGRYALEVVAAGGHHLATTYTIIHILPMRSLS
jgi:magnesium chelatase family protein